MMLANVVPPDMTIGEAGITGLLGYGVVFLGLFLLMVVVIVMGKILSGKRTADSQSAAPVSAAPPAPVSGKAAPGSAGQLKLYDTPPKDAAMCMAIVADTLGKPLNELRFLSIKEVKNDEI